MARWTRPDQPSHARICNYLLGGYNYTEADRCAADRLQEINPAIRQMVRDSRLFTGHAIRWAARSVNQFIDLRCGMPPGEQTHDMARSVRSSAAVAYVDDDPEVADHFDTLLEEEHDGLAFGAADMRDPGAVLAGPGVRKVIDLNAPVCLLFAMVLHLMPPDRARDLAATYSGMIVPGSYVAISCPRIDDDAMWAQITAAGCVPSDRNFTRDQFSALFDGLELIPPGIAPAAHLRPGWDSVLETAPGPAYMVGAIGRKP